MWVMAALQAGGDPPPQEHKEEEGEETATYVPPHLQMCHRHPTAASHTAQPPTRGLVRVGAPHTTATTTAHGRAQHHHPHHHRSYHHHSHHHHCHHCHGYGRQSPQPP